MGKPGIVRALLLTLTLGGCAVEVHPPGPPIAPAALADGGWRAADGVTLPMRVWPPAGRPLAVVLAVHGMNDYSHAFEEPGKALAARGIAVYAYDQRGFGRGPHPGTWSSGEAMAADLRAAATLIARRHPGVPLYLLGESMGGAVVMVAVAGQPPPEVAGIILSAPAVWGRDDMNIFQCAALWLSYHVVPGWELTGQGLEIQPSDNIEMLRQLSLDPLVIKATRVDAIKGLVDLMDQAVAAAPLVGPPALVLVGAKDEIIPAAPTWRTIARLPAIGATQRVAFYPRGYHMLLRDLQAATVIDDIAAWIADSTRPLPSGADLGAEAELAKRR